MNKGISLVYRPARPTDIESVRELVLRVFDEFVAPLYVPAGVDAFHDYLAVDKVESRFGRNHLLYLAESGGKPIGAVEIRDNSHIALLFVDKAFQGLGIARALVSRALAECRRENPDLEALTVNSAPNSVEVYRRMGFAALGPEETRDGIRFTPMALPVSAT